ncbi:MAG TPA: MmcQ/YjbR family DNA-binding protein [Terriglobales bacterium]|jgi:predicted DNA-binding protein (MmcQ/YjbR family)
MDIETLRRCCLAFPHATENVQWGYDLCFKIDGKLFAVTPLEPAPTRLSFKASPDNFAELCERPGIIPAPYMARAQWVALQQLNAIPDSELRELLRKSYRMVFARLPKKRQLELQGAAAEPPAKKKPKPKPQAKVKVKVKPAKKSAKSKPTPKPQAKKKAAKKKTPKAGRGR